MDTANKICLILLLLGMAGMAHAGGSSPYASVGAVGASADKFNAEIVRKLQERVDENQRKLVVR
jgi:hypothetical protein